MQSVEQQMITKVATIIRNSEVNCDLKKQIELSSFLPLRTVDTQGKSAYTGFWKKLGVTENVEEVEKGIGKDPILEELLGYKGSGQNARSLDKYLGASIPNDKSVLIGMILLYCLIFDIYL
jgi:hypothetical protein